MIQESLNINPFGNLCEKEMMRCYSPGSEVAHLEKFLKRPKVKIALIGNPGMGKTSLLKYISTNAEVACFDSMQKINIIKRLSILNRNDKLLFSLHKKIEMPELVFFPDVMYVSMAIPSFSELMKILLLRVKGNECARQLVTPEKVNVLLKKNNGNIRAILKELYLDYYNLTVAKGSRI
ncbi:MAG: hypothetical protein MRY83_06055 [Flavobacteriales bacterium]|nr:hypothetical protein [Flavobacteriales bacterium]